MIRRQELPKEQYWNIDNRMLICTSDHCRHHQYGVSDTRISWAKVPDTAKQFAIEVLGEGPARMYWRRYYRDAP